MLTSISTTAMSVFSRISRASFAEVGFDQVLAQFAEHDLIAEQLGRLIIHHEDVDFLVCAHEFYSVLSVRSRSLKPAAANCYR